MNSVSESVSRLLQGNRRVVPALAIIVLLASLLVYQWGRGYHAEAVEEISVLSEQYQMHRSRAEKTGDIATRTQKALKDVEALEGRLLKARTETLGAAVLQEAVKPLATKRKIKMSSEKVLSPVEAGEYTRIPVEFQFRSDLSQLKGFITDLKTSEVLMNVKSLSIKTPGQAPGGKLEVTLVIESALRK